jgi:DNA (cytosine-5)-methyltransferase 1
MRGDRPAQTITTGFGVMGKGRFVNPHERRTITPHEAARIQSFPDFFDFAVVNRTVIQKVIGNAVPPKLGYAVGLHLLR